jgi:SOS response associated peptidase (SRAP)
VSGRLREPSHWPRHSANWPRSAPGRPGSRLNYGRLGWRWWRSGQRSRPNRSSCWLRLCRSVDPASPDTVLLTANRTYVAVRARLRFLRMRNHAESRNDDPDDCRAHDHHSPPPLRHRSQHPWYFTARDGAPIITASGLWDEWKDRATGERLTSCTMIIIQPSDFAAEIHDPMPAFLTEAQFTPWLSGEAGAGILKPVA